jgi:hypothetical protein
LEFRPTRAGGASLRFLTAPGGLLAAVEGVERARSLPGVLELGITLRPGERGGVVAFDNARHGYVVTAGATRDEAVARADAVARTIVFRMRDQGPANAPRKIVSSSSKAS